MNDKSKIVIGLIIFLAIITFPFWYNMGKATSAPEPKLSDKAKAAKVCVEPKEYMKAEHMHILDNWRNEVVRKGNRTYKSSTGKEYNISLSSGEESCLGCHTDKAEFCDKCHDYASVEPYCWDCHIDPKEKKK
ncbi:MAG: sulfate reduction electron transfer complex DsrMKJOP subunit DsrJ [Deltaproteobacteria bacterium]|nr:sulfate reduction electron transfer complex DsrMKJOP subunit DsrJ [Deltaproteobacteria bacterium]